MNLQQFSLGLTTLACGLIAGLYYAYSCSVNPGLSRLDDLAYLKAMRHINSAIQNPMFFATFFGVLFLGGWSALVHFPHPAKRRWILAGFLVYLLFSFGITLIGNVPLNENLAAAPLEKLTGPEQSQLRESFEKPWKRWHGIRTVATTISFVLFLVSLLVEEGKD